MARIGELIGPNGEVMHPKTSASVVYLEDGRSVEQVLSDDIDYGNVVFQDNSYKFDSDVEDDFAKTVVIKGQTYQNILPEPSTHVLSNNKEMFKVNEGLDPIVEIVDGVSKSAILNGQTLVNLTDKSAAISIGGTVAGASSNAILKTSVSHTKSEATVTTAGYWNAYIGLKIIPILKPSTTYLVTVGNYTNTKGITLQSAKFKKIGETVSSTNVKVRDNVFKITLNSDFAIDSSASYTVVFECSNYNQEYEVGDSWSCENIMVIEYQEGMENWDVPYFEGMSSCKMPVLQTVGKNLFDGINRGYYLNIATILVGQTSEDSGGVVDVSNIDEITISSTTTQSRFRVACTNTLPLQQWESVTTYNGVNLDGNSLAKTTIDCSNYKYLIVNATDLSVIQVEQGTVATSYEPYKANILSTQINLTSDMFEQGGITTAKFGVSYSAVKTSRTDRIRVKELIPVKPSTSYYLKLPTEINGWCNMYDRNGLLLNTSSINANTMGTTSDETYYVGVVLNKKDSSLDITPSEISGKTMFLSQEVVLRSLPNGVKDTLNLNTGEYVQRIGEITVCPTSVSQIEILSQDYTNTIMARIKSIPSIVIKSKMDEKQHLCDKYPYEFINDDYEHVYFNVESNPTFAIFLNRSKLSSQDANGVFQYLSNNPIVIQSELANPVIKTVDLSTSGNWEKVVLDGSENWVRHGNYGSVTRFNVTISNMAIGLYHVFSDKFSRGAIATNDLECVNNHYSANQFQLQIKTSRLTSDSVDGLKQYLSQNPLTVWYQTKTHLDSTQVKQPIFFKDGHIIQSSGTDHSLIPTLDYQAKTSNSYVMDLLKAGTWTIKSDSCSGVMYIGSQDLHFGLNSTNRIITLTQGQINSLPNKLWFFDKTFENGMVLEGDLTSKAIPYFKGIKSAFEDESEIEVLSTGKNLFDKHTVLFSHSTDANGTVISSPQYVVSELISVKPNTVYTVKHFVVVVMYDKDKKYISQLNADYEQRTFTTPATCAYVRIRNWGLLDGVELQKQMIEKVVLQEGDTIVSYEPYKSNNTKIPLSCGVNKVSEPLAISTEFGRWVVDTGAPEATNETRRSIRAINIPENTSEICFYNNGILRAVNFHALDENENYVEYIHSADGRVVVKDKYKKFKIHLGINDSSNLSCRFTTINNKALRSLPNGVCDEVIIDRMKKKATLIQRVGHSVINSEFAKNGGRWGNTKDTDPCWGFHCGNYVQGSFKLNEHNSINDKLPIKAMATTGDPLMGYYQSNPHIALRSEEVCDMKMALNWLDRNPINFYYQLVTPVITEVDLEGFPYIYKEGHIFLSEGIAPTVGVEYSLNQGQRIASQVETLQRHEKQFSKLEQYFVDLVYSDYNFALLRFSEKLRQQEGDI